jgi:hypothetical protein
VCVRVCVGGGHRRDWGEGDWERGTEERYVMLSHTCRLMQGTTPVNDEGAATIPTTLPVITALTCETINRALIATFGSTSPLLLRPQITRQEAIAATLPHMTIMAGVHALIDADVNMMRASLVRTPTWQPVRLSPEFGQPWGCTHDITEHHKPM